MSCPRTTKPLLVAVGSINDAFAIPHRISHDCPLSGRHRGSGQPWQRVNGCQGKANRWNDGDSFHVITGDAGKEIVARLYFVDAPEAETAYRDRIAEQAVYFGITSEQAVQIAHEAAAFTEKRLAIPFTVWTR
jgi:endonuclease YncB( thermonuclease family)